MNYSKIFLSVSACLFLKLNGQIGCMDNSKHTHIKDGYDYKTLHYVTCTCPCQKKRHSARKNKCFQCNHYAKPDTQVYDMSFLYEKSEKSIFPTIKPFKYS